MASNPFVIGQWVRGGKFFGRGREIAEVLEGPRNCLWLLGTRRIGKTSFLKQVELLAASDPGKRYFPLFWDFQGADDPEELHRSFGEAILDAGDRLEEIGIRESDVELPGLFQSIGALRRRLKTYDRKLLLLCDEVEELIKLNVKDGSILRKLRRELQSHEDIRSVLASTIRLWSLAETGGDTSPFLHGFAPPVYLRGLDAEDATALLRQASGAQDSESRFEAAAIEEIRSKCDHHPYLMQLVGKRYLELGDLREAVEQVACDQMVSYFFAVDFDMLSAAERDVIRIIAESSAASSDSLLDKVAIPPGELNGSLLRLENLGYIQRDPSGRFELVNYFFRRWFLARPAAGSEPRKGSTGEDAARPIGDQSTVIGEARFEKIEGRYSLLKEIGHGAMGVVYKARDEELDEIIALKILRPEFCASSGVLERFRREVLLARNISHPNILRIYHLGDHQGRKYLAMKLVEGRTLGRAIAEEKMLSISTTLNIGWKLASALEAAHAERIVHRDIKPQNILIDQRGEPFLSDFGLARLLDSPGTTRSGAFLGTPQYASPEQARMLPADERSDLYSLGLVLFEMATGRRPFVADTSEEILDLHRSAAPPDPSECRPEIPRPLADAILRCLRKAPADRFQSARALRLALEKLNA